jgi:hypothetical protein
VERKGGFRLLVAGKVELKVELEAGGGSREPVAEAYRPPYPADCIDCREMSAVEAMPCMRNLKSSALEAFSSAVS